LLLVASIAAQRRWSLRWDRHLRQRRRRGRRQAGSAGGCGGSIVSDASGVFINGKPMARVGDAAGCGGK